mmetsp:Transcript_9481/g.27305  ORF Transcript_9481/g.27305 Transcript_9481/m.27305 type:complete len:142 (+) Transcript_9481:1007-1432(+)
MLAAHAQQVNGCVSTTLTRKHSYHSGRLLASLDGDAAALDGHGVWCAEQVEHGQLRVEEPLDRRPRTAMCTSSTGGKSCFAHLTRGSLPGNPRGQGWELSDNRMPRTGMLISTENRLPSCPPIWPVSASRKVTALLGASLS